MTLCSYVVDFRSLKSVNSPGESGDSILRNETADDGGASVCHSSSISVEELNQEILEKSSLVQGIF